MIIFDLEVSDKSDMGLGQSAGPAEVRAERLLLGLGMSVVLLTFLIEGWEEAGTWIYLRAGLAALGLFAIVTVFARLQITQKTISKLVEQSTLHQERATLSLEFLGALGAEMHANLSRVAGRAAVLLDLWQGLNDLNKRKFVTKIVDATQDLVRSAKDVVDFSHRNWESPELRPCNVADEAQEVLRVLDWGESESTIRTQIPRQLCVMADPTRLRRSLEILLTQTRRDPKDRLVLRARPVKKQVVISIDALTEFSVIHLDAATEQIQLPDSDSLGMILVRRFVKSMNGQFSIETSSIGGFTYSISLPAWKSKSGPTAASSTLGSDLVHERRTYK